MLAACAAELFQHQVAMCNAWNKIAGIYVELGNFSDFLEYLWSLSLFQLRSYLLY